MEQARASRGVWIALTICVALVVLAFLAATPPSARGFYYVAWLIPTGFAWRHRSRWQPSLQASPLGEFPVYLALGILMILAEETLAGLAVNLLRAPNFGELMRSVPQFYANNLLLLPGFMLGWYILLKRFAYPAREVFVLVGVFGLFAEKILSHILNYPIMGSLLVLPTMFTYMAIIAPSLLSLRSTGTRQLPKGGRILLGFFVPIAVSIPFLYVHALLTQAGWLDPTVLTR